MAAVSYRKDIDEYSEGDLRRELRQRAADQAADLCDYCHHPAGVEPSCRFRDRHYALTRAVPGVDLLIQFLQDRPDVFTEVLRAIRTPTPTCEGFQGECHRLVLWPTRSMTAYTWDGTGEDPNRDKMYCPTCSREYTAEMQEKWDDYQSGLL